MTDLTKNIFSGFLWTGIQTVGTKIISLGTQLVLAWLLMPKDFGKVSIALSLTSITFLLQGLGLSDVLISRSQAYHLNFNLAKSIALATSFICMLLTIIIGIAAGIYVYNDIEITFLILIYSISVPFNSMSIVADARLRIDLKFRQLSIIRITEFFLSNFILLGLVFLDYGIYSFVIAPVISAIFRYILLHKYANVRHRFEITFNHYKYLLTNSIYVFFHNLFQTVIRQSDYLIIGIYVSTQAVGLYFMGYSLSVQVIALLVASLSPVFFPVLRKIPPNETEKIQNVLVKLVMVFSIFGMSFSLLQASIAGPLIRLFLEDKWIDTILIVQILSIGIGFNVACTVWAVSLRLREKFKKMAILSLTSAIVFLCIIITFTKMFNILGTAVGVSLYNIVINISLLIISLRRYKVKAISIFKILFSYFFLSLIIFYSCYYLTNKYVLNDWIRIFTSGILPTLIYFAILYFFDANSKKIFNMLLKKINIKKSI